jgi:fibrillarin-like rRNA methylase
MHGLEETKAMNDRAYRKWFEQRNKLQCQALQELLEALSKEELILRLTVNLNKKGGE